MILLLGFATGLALVAPVGPVALTLFGIGAEQGRRAAIAGAGGVVLADLCTMPIALLAAGSVQAVDATVVTALEVVMGASLVALGVVTVWRADDARTVLGGITRPTRTLAAMTALNPLSLVAWMGLALALPASIRTPAALVAFGVGIVLASGAWHTTLAAASGSLGARLGDRTRTRIAQVSGVVLVVVGAYLMV